MTSTRSGPGEPRVQGWFLFFSSLPSKPVGNRVKIWRKLSKSGAVQIKGSVYVLPGREEHREFFQWLVAEIVSMGGEAAFARVERVESLPDNEIVANFARRKAEDYRKIDQALAGLERRIESARRGGATSAGKGLRGTMDRLRREYDGARRTDFFPTAGGPALAERIEQARAALEALAASGTKRPESAIPARSAGAYRGRRWVTRAGPFVDRMASAWLIRRFIDADAVFDFIPGQDTSGAGPDAVVYDMAGGEFAHVGDLCTFEVLMRSFGLEDAALAQVAEVVHDLDVGGGRHRHAEAAGVAEILDGVRRTASDDAEALERGLAVFEMLYAAKGPRRADGHG